MPKLTQVKETKRGRYALFFDGEFAFSLDEDTFAMAGLHTGDELEEWQIHDLQTKSGTMQPGSFIKSSAAALTPTALPPPWQKCRS